MLWKTVLYCVSLSSPEWVSWSPPLSDIRAPSWLSFEEGGGAGDMAVFIADKCRGGLGHQHPTSSHHTGNILATEDEQRPAEESPHEESAGAQVPSRPRAPRLFFGSCRQKWQVTQWTVGWPGMRARDVLGPLIRVKPPWQDPCLSAYGIFFQLILPGFWHVH